MTPENKHNLGYTLEQKIAYGIKFLHREPIRHQRCIGVTEDLLAAVKEVVELVAFDATTVRSYVTAIIKSHIRHYKVIHEYLKREAYQQTLPGDTEEYGIAVREYSDRFLSKNTEYRGAAWLHVESECVDALARLVKWAGTGATIGSLAEAIITDHLLRHDKLLEEMKSDAFNFKP